VTLKPRWLLVWVALLARLALGAEAPAQPPEGAILLFDGKDTSKWSNAKVTEDGCLLAGAVTKDKFQDFTLHLEFMMDGEVSEKNAGNSGVYLQQRYEIQILNTAHKKPPGKGDCGAIYKFKAPDQNAAKPPREWQTYDITFQAPRWDGDKKTQNARISVLHNGIPIHNDVEVPNKTGSGKPEGPDPGPLYLQQHGNRVLFRNIWILESKKENGRGKT
jgi:hypothetical protein